MKQGSYIHKTGKVVAARELRPRKTGRIWKIGPYFWIQYYVNGKQRRESSHSGDRAVAEKLLTHRLVGMDHNILPEGPLKYETIRNAYVDSLVNKERKTLARTPDGEIKLMKDGRPCPPPVAHCDRFFKGKRVASISRAMIARFVKRLKGEGLQNATVNRSLSALGAMFTIARKDGLVHKPFAIEKLPESDAREGFFEREQYLALRAVLPAHARLALDIGYWTGMRDGEIKKIKWEQVKKENGVWTIRLMRRQTKTMKARTIPVAAGLGIVLDEAHAKRHPGFELVCSRTTRTGKIVPVGDFRKAWHVGCVKAKLSVWVDRKTGERFLAKPKGKTECDVRCVGMLFHDLRRTGVRNLVRAGVPEKVAMTISGHTTPSIFQRYNIVSEGDLADAAVKLQKYADGTNDGTNENSTSKNANERNRVTSIASAS